MNMKINSKTEKLLMSFIVFPMVISRFWNCFQDQASLKILSSLNVRRAEMAPLDELLYSQLSRISTKLIITIRESKRLNLSWVYVFTPSPKTLSTISIAKTAKNTKLTVSNFCKILGSILYLSCAKTKVFAIIVELIIVQNQLWETKDKEWRKIGLCEDLKDNQCCSAVVSDCSTSSMASDYCDSSSLYLANSLILV